MTLRQRILRLLNEWPAEDAIPNVLAMWAELPDDVTLGQVSRAVRGLENDDLVACHMCSSGKAVRITEAGRKAAQEVIS